MNGSVTGKPTIYWAQCPSSGHTQAEEHPPVPLEARHTGGPPKLATLLDPQKEKTLRPPHFWRTLELIMLMRYCPANHSR